MEEQEQGISLPPNYVTFLQLKERWLKQQQQQQQQSTPQPTHDSAPKIPNEAVTSRTNRHRSVDRFKSDATIHDSGSEIGPDVVALRDSGSKNPNEAVRGRNHNRAVYRLKQEVPVHDSGSKTVVEVADNRLIVEDTNQSNFKRSRKKNSSRGRNPRFVTGQNQTGGSTALPEPGPVADNHLIVEKHNRSNSKLSTKENGFRGRNPRFLTGQNQTGGSTTLPEPEPKPVADNHSIVENHNQSNSKISTKENGFRGRNPRYSTGQNQTGVTSPLPEPEPEPVANNHSIVENNNHSNSKLSTKKNSSRNRNPRFVTGVNENGGSTLLPEREPEPVADNHSIVEKHNQSNSKSSKKKNSSRSRNPRFNTGENENGNGGSTSLPDPQLETVADNHSIIEKKNQSNSKKKSNSRGRNPRFVAVQNQNGGSTPLPEPEPEPEPEPQPIADNHSIIEKKNQSNSKLSKKKNSSRNRNPRFLTGENQTGSSTPLPEPEPEPVQEKKQHSQVWEPKGKTAPFAKNVDDVSCGDLGVEAVAAAVKELNMTNVSRNSNGRYGSGRFQGAKGPIPVKKGQITGVWVKKGESAPN